MAIMIDINSNYLDKKTTVKVLKGSCGVGLFVKQIVNFSSGEERWCANKVMTHEQAKELRDFLINHYPLEK